jgi:hypothetical protein
MKFQGNATNDLDEINDIVFWAAIPSPCVTAWNNHGVSQSPGEKKHVIPAQAGIYSASPIANALWIPACAGMTNGGQYQRAFWHESCDIAAVVIIAAFTIT